MSWTFNFRAGGKPADFSEAADAAKEAYLAEQAGFNQPRSAEDIEQIDAAVSAARNIVAAKVLGGADNEYSVTLTGHANAGHAPDPQYANDMVHIVVQQV